MTPEELEKARRDLAIAQGWELPPAEPTPPPAATPPAPPAVPPAAPASPSAPPPAAPAPARGPSLRETIRETAREVGVAVAESLRAGQPEPPPPAPEPGLQLSPEDQETLEVCQYLAKSDPQEHGELPGLLIDYFTALYNYQDEWMRNNPGKEWNPDDEEHKGWYATNPAPVDFETVETARREIEIDRRVNEKVEQRMKPLEQKITMVEEERLLNQALPAINGTYLQAQVDMLREINPELAKLVSDGPPNWRPAFTPENLAKLEQADPVAFDVVSEIVGTQLQPVVLELEKTVIAGLKHRLDPQRNPVHGFIDQHRREAERILSQADRQTQLDEQGRQWLTVQDMFQRQEAIRTGRGTAAQKEAELERLHQNYWSLTIDHLRETITSFLASEATKKIEKIDSLGRKKYSTTATPPPEAPRPSVWSTEPTPPPSTARSRPPSTGSPADAMPAGENGRPVGGNKGDQAVAVHFK